jgi:hypothetical protein
MKTYKLEAVVLASFALAACGGSQPANTANTTNAANTTAVTPAPNASQSPSATNDSSATSPSGVFKAQNEARKNKNAATMQSNLSRASLELIEKDARARGITLDEWLTLDEEGNDEITTIQTRNEKIDGDTATVEINTDGGEEWDVMPFVKEDGRWKIAMDKYVANLQKRIEEENAAQADAQTEETQP